MDGDSSNLLAWLFLVFSIVAFSLATLVEASLKSVQREHVQWLVTQGVRHSRHLESLFLAHKGPTGAISILKYAFFASSLLSGAALVAIGDDRWWPVAVTGVIVFCLLGIVHLLVARLGQALGERAALKAAVPVRGLEWLLSPVLMIEATVSRAWTRASAEPADPSWEAVPSTDANGEPLDEREVKMIRAIVRLDQTVAREIMVPRVDMVGAELGTPLGELAELMLSSGHSRIPVFQENLDRIVGIAYARDILRHLSHSDEAPATLTESLVRPALFVPELKPLEELLDEFQEKRVHLAIVVDEYGGVSGIVTIEDLLEEIVGEIRDEFDVGDLEIEPVGDNEYLMNARVGIDQLKDLLSVDLEGEGFDTLGGFVYNSLGRIPSLGDTVVHDGLKIEVLSTVGRRLKMLRVTRLPAGDTGR